MKHISLLWFLLQNCNAINIHEKCFLHMVYGQFKQIKWGGQQILEYCVLKEPLGKREGEALIYPGR